MVNLDKKILDDITQYCKLNGIEDTTQFINKCVKDGFILDKWGVGPFLPKSQIQEVPVEKIITKEVLVEIPIEKEVIVEKIITKEVKDEQLITELSKLNKEIEIKNLTIQEQNNKIEQLEDVLEHFKSLTVNRRTEYLRTSNLKDTYLD
jgi:hypothetical protein